MARTLSGEWHSGYTYQTGDSSEELISLHVLNLMPGTVTDLVGISQPDPTGSKLTLALNYGNDTRTLTGFWHESTSPIGHYKGVVFHGALQLILNGSLDKAQGIWIGHNTDATRVKSGEWGLKKI